MHIRRPGGGAEGGRGVRVSHNRLVVLLLLLLLLLLVVMMVMLGMSVMLLIIDADDADDADADTMVQWLWWCLIVHGSMAVVVSDCPWFNSCGGI